ncbi:nitroreductase family protein [Streptococcus pneumoniae]|uniref:nitroreductase family protein n=1 Tax=Streptococcus pneumoniae TaxID=1313 RepID=UPI0010E6ECFD|nr:nitroreductase family protein [Streptococcus pneumoniae]MBW5122534.1 nitroreductase family protein [Streptococcus pneumoniae]MBW5194943.1 nitroreductase family protein [Streptococcus pneumoniae]MDG7290842.1 nitroreductase family protein [Streptococcus pneumoniae]MDG7351677.1 nitroreductase family protein [Streptococcus pneumoniae]MDG7356410.1 nitroreductase family protein [Streptococcus pneumoniae]
MLHELLKKNRNYRDLKKLKVSKERLKDQVEMAISNTRYAHSIRNKQSLRYLILFDIQKELNLYISEKMFKEIDEVPYFRPSGYIIIMNDDQILDNERSVYCNAGICAQIITLSLMESNIDSCIISVYNDKNINTYINLDKKLSPVLIIGFGRRVRSSTIIEISSDESTQYYIEDAGVVVPKLRKNDIILNRD